MFSSPEDLFFETEKFLVRKCKLDDAPYFLKFWDDHEVMQLIGDGTWGGGKQVVLEVLEKNISSYAKKDGLGFGSIVDKDSNEVVGEAGLSKLQNSKEIEAGYLLRRDYWGKGYGSQILRGLLDYGFNVLHIDRIIAVAHPDNIASVRIMEKCGMQFMGKAYYHNRLSVKYSKENPNTASS